MQKAESIKLNIFKSILTYESHATYEKPNVIRSYCKTKKQQKARNKSNRARKSRKRNKP